MSTKKRQNICEIFKKIKVDKSIGHFFTEVININWEKHLSMMYNFWENILFGVARCGYRYQKQDDGFFLKAGLTPIFMSKDAEGFHPDYFQFWGGISFGVSF